MVDTTSTKPKRPVFVLARTPAAERVRCPVVEWTDICHGQRGRRFLFITHQPYRDTSRWTSTTNKRPFFVYTHNWLKVGCSSTLEGAMRIAEREA
jgi:hypothetical protein